MRRAAGFTVYVESFDRRRDMTAGFKRYAATLTPGGCSVNDWGTKGTWYQEQRAEHHRCASPATPTPMATTG